MLACAQHPATVSRDAPKHFFISCYEDDGRSGFIGRASNDLYTTDDYSENIRKGRTGLLVKANVIHRLGHFQYSQGVNQCGILLSGAALAMKNRRRDSAGSAGN